ncbi:MAG: CapA family protein [Marinilabiliaceae bacterium]|nr:CapA family protein [Marinilabiliaceae bacterium]
MRIGFIGDIILSDSACVDEKLVARLNENDFNVANLEAPFITSDMNPARKAGLHQLTESVELLKRLNVKVVSLANNHMRDFGSDGLLNTIAHLEKNGIQYFGAGKNRNEALKPTELVVNNRRFRFYGAMQTFFLSHHFASNQSAGVAPWEPGYFKPSKDDAVNVLFLHWNQEFEDYPEPASKYFAEQACDYFHLVIGSHAHCIQGIQQYQDSSIVYSLGNFILPHTDYCNTFLNPYPEKSYKGLVFNWHPDREKSDTVITTQIESNGASIRGIQESSIEACLELGELSEPLQWDYSQYRRFYKSVRQDKKRPILSRNKLVNLVRLKLYIRLIVLFHKVELWLATLLQIIGLRGLIRKFLSVFIKRYK